MANAKQNKTKTLDHRKGQLEQLEQAISLLVKKLDDLRQKNQKLNLFQSVSLGLYEELDKLSKKSGADQVTELALAQVNDCIRDSKAFLVDDPYIQKLKEFVPAGENPQNRDVVIVMRQIRQGLERFAQILDVSRTQNDKLLNDAKGVQCAVELFIQGEDEVAESNLKEYETAASERWMRSKPYGDGELYFSFEVLDRTDITTFFNVE